MRKLIIGLIAVGFVASLFWGYALVMDAAPIEARDVSGSDDLEMPELGDAVQRAGDTDVRGAEKAKYVILDPETKKKSRVFGFDKLLNPGMDTSHRQVEKPYMVFYESNYRCRIDADMGMFQVESSIPKDAQLDGNVKIHITPKPGSRMSETIIEMDDLIFSSERSEFATDGKVSIVSDQVLLKGFGLTVIFDAASGRIDYLQIRDLDELRLQGLAEPKSGTTAVKAKTSPTAGSDRLASTTRPAGDSVVPSGKTDRAQTESTLPSRYYQCILEDNVKIEYGSEFVVAGAEQVNIQNILFSKLNQGTEADAPPERIKDKSKKAAKPDQPSDEPVETAQNIESSTEVVVTCDGGILLRPMQNEAAEQTPVAQSALSVEVADAPSRMAKTTEEPSEVIFDRGMDPVFAQSVSLSFSPAVQAVNLMGPTTQPQPGHTAGDTIMETDPEPNNAPPAKFEARKIDYDLLTGAGLAHGPVRFTFYQPADPNSMTTEPQIPVVITADQDAQFIADESRTIKQVVFNENVLAERRSPQVEFSQVDHLHGNKLTISLDENAEGKMDISRISMTEGNVYVQSQRLKDEQIFSDIKLYCTEMSYDRANDANDIILIEGPGSIELVNNIHSQTVDSDPNDARYRPYVARIKKFETIRWDMDQQSIVADGQNDTMTLEYYPILDGKVEKRIFISSMRFDLSYLTDPTGNTVLKRVFTDQGIVYKEENADCSKTLHTIIGQTLDYDMVDGGGWAKIEGTPAVPCNVDGARMPFVHIHPVTGEIKASISTTPGVMESR